MRAVQANRGMASSVQGLYMAELQKIASRKDDGVRCCSSHMRRQRFASDALTCSMDPVQVDEDLVAQMAAMKSKSQMEIDAAVVCDPQS